MDPDPNHQVINLSRLHLIPRNGIEFAFEPVTRLPKDEDCPICFRAYGKTEKNDVAPPCTAIRVLPCGHVLGKHCLKVHRSMTNDTRCPYCRQKLSPKDHPSHPARLTKSQKFFQRISETRWYQIQEQLLLKHMNKYLNSNFLPYKDSRLALQHGFYHDTCRLWLVAHLHVLLTILYSHVLHVMTFEIFHLVLVTGLYSYYFLLGSSKPVYDIFWETSPRGQASGPLLWLIIVYRYSFYITPILHSMTSVSIIFREVKRANADAT
jgi:hypothetical protein